MPASKACVQPSLRASIHPLKTKASPRPANRSRGGGQCPLLPGLPDDLAIAVLIRVPRADHWKLRLVCRRWHRLLAGNYFYALRRRLGLAEQWLYAVTRHGHDGHVSWHALATSRGGGGAWRTLPPLPPEYAGAGADGFGSAVLGGCHLYLLGGSTDPRGSGGGGGGAMRRVVFYSARSNRWHRAPDMLRRRRSFAACVMNNRLYVAGGESGGGGAAALKSAEVFDPAKNRWSFVAEMAVAMVPFVGAVHGGRWYLKGLDAENQQQVVSQVYSPATDTWTVVLDGMVTGWRSPSACLDDGRIFAADCKDGCRLKVYDEVADAWATCFVDSKQHRGSSPAMEAAAIVALQGRICVVRNDMSVLAVDVAEGEGKQQRWETLTGKSHGKGFVTGLLSNLAGRGRAKNRILHCQVLEA
ncbi:hypothetical protein HU200_003548 [Digitaria exilis]|uniref:F-box domain-containing protein n=1 Tax=Digitaria exilis TaxID=1010633 RepID=A0A835KVU5_9POAL|nr:hypothetical protein HU200_003548 [Digitaria exilis]CAB3449263.1 unnamed protein product [Digitaria exilis]